MFLQAFEDATLPFEDWSHEAHLRMAWNYIKQYGAEGAQPYIKPVHTVTAVVHVIFILSELDQIVCATVLLQMHEYRHVFPIMFLFCMVFTNLRKFGNFLPGLKHFGKFRKFTIMVNGNSAEGGFRKKEAKWWIIKENIKLTECAPRPGPCKEY